MRGPSDIAASLIDRAWERVDDVTSRLWKTRTARRLRRTAGDRFAKLAWSWKQFQWRVVEPALETTWEFIAAAASWAHGRASDLNWRVARWGEPRIRSLHSWSAERAQAARDRRSALEYWWRKRFGDRVEAIRDSISNSSMASSGVEQFEHLSKRAGGTAVLWRLAVCVLAVLFLMWRLKPAPAPPPSASELEMARSFFSPQPAAPGASANGGPGAGTPPRSPGR